MKHSMESPTLRNSVEKVFWKLSVDNKFVVIAPRMKHFSYVYMHYAELKKKKKQSEVRN